MDSNQYTMLSQMYSFVGNSLLTPMNQTHGPGLDPAFWAALPDFGSAEVDKALEGLCAFAQDAQARSAAGEDPVTQASYEHTRLFVGPPSPAAAPWETFYPELAEGAQKSEVTCGFGQPTFAMKELLREAGLQLVAENHQYEDHIGLELLYLGVLVEGGEVAKATAFIAEHPGRWIGRLQERAVQVFPDGYIVRLLTLARALMGLEL